MTRELPPVVFDQVVRSFGGAPEAERLRRVHTYHVVERPIDPSQCPFPGCDIRGEDWFLEMHWDMTQRHRPVDR